MRSRVRCVFGVLLAALVAYPVLRSPADDGFPFSTYPMFSLARPAETTVNSAVGFDAAQQRVTLSPRIVGGTPEVIQAAGTITQAISSNSTGALCNELLARAPSAVVAIEVVTETYDVIAYFDGNEDPVRRTVHARCES